MGGDVILDNYDVLILRADFTTSICRYYNALYMSYKSSTERLTGLTELIEHLASFFSLKYKSLKCD